MRQRSSASHSNSSTPDSWSRTSELGNSSSLFSDSPVLDQDKLVFVSNKGKFAEQPAPVFVFKENKSQRPLHTEQNNKMVREVSPAKPPRPSHEQPLRPLPVDKTNVSKPLARPTVPVFGQPTKMESPLSRAAKDVFVQPKKRPEHHRPEGQSNHTHLHAAKEGVKKMLDPFLGRSSEQENNLDLDDDSVLEIAKPQNRPMAKPAYVPVQIAKPTDIPFKTVKAAPQPMFSSLESNHGGYASASNCGGFQPTTVFGGGSSSMDPYRDMLAPAPYTYVDTAKAQDDIKALLEGAFEDDEDDKPRTRSRKKKQAAHAKDLLSKMNDLKVGENAPEEAEAEEEEEEGEEDDGTVEGVKVKLLPHQIAGLEWMKGRELGTRKKGVVPKGGLLADDMGLGKTLQSVSLIIQNPKPKDEAEMKERKLPANVDKCTLVVAPLSLIRQWEAEIKDKVESSHALRVLVHHGPQRTKRFADLTRYDVVITTYQILVSEWGNSTEDLKVGCFGLYWYRVILDEAHTIKNRNAKSTQACYALRSVYRWCLTGTPMQNNLDELQSLVKFLRIKPYDDLREWKDQIDRPMKNGRGDVAITRLQHYLKIFMKRRTKAILKEEGALNPGGKPSAAGEANTTGFKVTERRIEKVFAEFSAEERHFYDRLEQRTDKSLEQMMDAQEKVNYASALVLLLRLRQACNHPKLVAGKLGEDSEAMAEAAISKSQRNDKASSADIDEIADMFGGLGVGTTKCEVCQLELSRELSKSGAVRCEECEEDLEIVDGQKKKKKEHRSKKHKKHRKHSQKEEGSDGEEEVRSKSKKLKNRPMILDSEDEEEVDKKPKKLKHRPMVLDSDDEEEEEEWIVSEKQRGATKLGKAGGTDDENAEGGGDWIGSEDSDSGDDLPDLSTLKKQKQRKKEVVSLDSNEESEGESSSGYDTEGSDSGSEEDSESETFSEDEVKMAKIASSTKIRHLLNILRAEIKEHKFIVFSQFTSMLDLIEPFLQIEGIRFTRYDGSMKNDLREASLQTLRNDKRCRVLLCSLKCGSLGLNLTAATRVVILEPFWNPFVEEQAIDRVHRLTQIINVIVYKITIKDSVEERILELQEKKRELANQTIEGAPKGAAGKLGMKEILGLFRRDAENAVPVGVGREGAGYVHSRTRVLLPAAAGQAGSGSAGGGREGTVQKEKQRKITPPVARGRERGEEDSVYGRRW